MKGNNNDLPYMGLVIDTHLPNESPISEDEQTKRKNMILTILKDTKIKEFFEPIESRMTLSSEVGFTKSENLKEFFNIAISKTDKKMNLEIFSCHRRWRAHINGKIFRHKYNSF